MPLDSAQHEGLEDHVQPAQLVLIQLAALVLRGILNIFGEPLIELIMGVEQARHDEMQECPKFYQTKSAQSSRHKTTVTNKPCIEFCIGVPVSRRRFRHWNPNSVFQRTLAEFLIF
jgi:hypothetical protein